MNLPRLRELESHFFPDCEKRVFFHDEMVYFELLVDGKPTTVPQSLADVVDTSRGPILAEALNALPHLLAIAEAAMLWRNGKEVAFKLDIAPSNLSDALNERERKDVKGKWISTVRRMCSPVQIDEYVKLLCAQHDYEVPARRKAITPEQELRAVRALLKVHAPAVLDVVNKELGR